jgi:hypothetical protein
MWTFLLIVLGVYVVGIAALWHLTAILDWRNGESWDEDKAWAIMLLYDTYLDKGAMASETLQHETAQFLAKVGYPNQEEWAWLEEEDGI